MAEATHAAVELLDEPTSKHVNAIVNAFQKWIGEHIEIWRGTPHGPEILEFAIGAAAEAEINYGGLFFTSRGQLFFRTGLGPVDIQDPHRVKFLIHMWTPPLARADFVLLR